MTVNADELELVLQRMLTELARARGVPAVRSRRRLEHTITIGATAFGLLVAMIPFVMARPAAPRVPTVSAAAAASLAPMKPEAVLVTPAPTLRRRIERPTRELHEPHEIVGREGYIPDL